MYIRRGPRSKNDSIEKHRFCVYSSSLLLISQTSSRASREVTIALNRNESASLSIDNNVLMYTLK